jgi:hypothetical protein
MPWTFNPFSGTFDQKGSGGGGGASYIDGEVQNFSALPTANPPAVDSAYLVREPEGTWLLNRKPAGIYIRVATTGTRATDWTYAGEFPDVFSDDKFVLYDETDSSKNLVFQLSGITTGTTRTLTAPNASGRIQIEGQPIGNTTPAAGTFTTLTANNGTLTASAPVLDLAQTWNNAAVAFTSLRLNITNTASLSAATGGSRLLDISIDGTPQVRFQRNFSTPVLYFGSTDTGIGASSTTLGFYTNGGLNMALGSGATGPVVRSDGSFAWSSTTSVTAASDLILRRDAANTLAQYNSTNAQTFNIYNTFTSSTNHERGFLKWNANVFQIGTEKGSGGGTARDLAFQTDGVTRMTFLTNGDVGIGTTSPERPLHIQASNAMARIDRTGTLGPAVLMIRMATLGTVTSSWLFGPATGFASVANDDFSIIDFGSTTSGTGGTQRLTISKSTGQLTLNGNLNLSTKDLVTDTTTGTKIGTGTTQKLGFFNATPVVQQAAVADATDAASTQDRLNDLLARLRTLGLIAT